MSNISRALIAALLITCLASASLYKCTRDERDVALQNAAIAIEANRINKETIEALEVEITKRDKLAAAWQEELAKEKKARDDIRKDLNELLEQNKTARDWSEYTTPDSVWVLLENNANSNGN